MALLARSRRIRFAALTVACALAAALTACGDSQGDDETGEAADYPTEPVKIIVPVGSGAFDTLARTIAPYLSDELGVPVVVENIPGPDGWNHIYRAEPDGYTIGTGQVLGQFSSALATDLPYDITEFSFLGRINAGDATLVTTPESGIESLDDLKEAAADGTHRYAVVNPQTSSYIQMAVLMDRLGVPVNYVSTEDFAGMITATIRGDADSTIMGYSTLVDHFEADTLQPVVVFTEDEDHPLADEGVPNIAEAGFPELESLVLDRSIVGPPGLPDEVMATFCSAFEAAMENEELIQKMNDGAMERNYWCDEDYAEFILGAQDTVAQFSDVLTAN